MRKPQGYLRLTDPDIGVIEQDSFQCGHCQKTCFCKPNPFGVNHIVVSGGIDRGSPQLLGGMCKVCMRLICPACTVKREAGEPCTPFEEAIENDNARSAFLKSLEEMNI